MLNIEEERHNLPCQCVLSCFDYWFAPHSGRLLLRKAFDDVDCGDDGAAGHTPKPKTPAPGRAIEAFSCGNISKAQVVKTSIFRRGISGVTFSHTFTSAGDEPRIKADSSNP
jgi:hypothetical protein